MALAKEIQLLLKDASAAVTSTIVIAEDHSNGQIQRRDATCQAQIPIAEITDKQQSIGGETLQQRLVGIAPGTV